MIVESKEPNHDAYLLLSFCPVSSTASSLHFSGSSHDVEAIRKLVWASTNYCFSNFSSPENSIASPGNPRILNASSARRRSLCSFPLSAFLSSQISLSFQSQSIKTGCCCLSEPTVKLRSNLALHFTSEAISDTGVNQVKAEFALNATVDIDFSESAGLSSLYLNTKSKIPVS